MKIKKIAALLLAVCMLFGFTSCKTLNLFRKNKLNPLDMLISYVRYDEGMRNSFLNGKDRFVQVLAPLYGMSQEQANDFLENNSRYGVYSIDTHIQNREEGSYTFTKVKVEGEHDGIWLNEGSINGEITVPPGGMTSDFTLSFVADNQKLSAAAIYETLSSLTFSAVYYDTPVDDEIIVEESEYKTLTARRYIEPPDDAGTLSEVKVSFASVQDASDYADIFKGNKAALVSYGIADAVADHYSAKDSKWECYALELDVANPNDGTLNILGAVVQANGQKGVWVSEKSLDGDEIGISGGSETKLYFLLLVDPSVAGGVTIADTVKSMDIALSCTLDRTDIEQIETCLRVPQNVKMTVQ